MKNIFLYIFLIAFLGCNKKKSIEKPENKANSHIENFKDSISTSKITLKAKNGKAVLIGNSIELLDDNLKLIDTISNVDGKIIDFTYVSDAFNNMINDNCEAYKYVKVNIKDIIGIVDGRKVYEILENRTSFDFIFKNKKYKIFETRFFGMGSEYDGSLTFCHEFYQPIIILDVENNSYKLVKNNKKPEHEDLYIIEDFKYFQLFDFDGFIDKIVSYKELDSEIVFKIKREYQEGSEDIEISLSFINNDFKTEYLSASGKKKELSQDCIFDQETQTDYFLKGIKELENYTWDNETKTAEIVLNDHWNLTLKRGGCDHFEMSAEFMVDRELDFEKDEKLIFDKISWISSLLNKEFDYEIIQECIEKQKLDINIEDNKRHIHFMDERIYESYYMLFYLSENGSNFFIRYYLY